MLRLVRDNRYYWLFTKAERGRLYDLCQGSPDPAVQALVRTLVVNTWPALSYQNFLVLAKLVDSISVAYRAPEEWIGGSWLQDADYRLIQPMFAPSVVSPIVTSLLTNTKGTILPPLVEEPEEEGYSSWAMWDTKTEEPSSKEPVVYLKAPVPALVSSSGKEEQEPSIPDCSPDNPLGACPEGFYCQGGVCVPIPLEEEEEYESKPNYGLIIGGSIVGLGILALLLRR